MLQVIWGKVSSSCFMSMLQQMIQVLENEYPWYEEADSVI